MGPTIKQILSNDIEDIINKEYTINGWVQSLRTSNIQFAFCLIKDGSNTKGIQIIVTEEFMNIDKIYIFIKNVKIGCSIKCFGKLVVSPAKGQKVELQLYDYLIYGNVEDGYLLSKNRINMDILRNYSHLRTRTNTFSSIFRIRSKLMMIIHEFYQNLGFLNLDPNIITINECEGGAGVFQVTEHDISNISNLNYRENKYNWKNDHFNKPAYLTVSSQLQLEALACGLGNVYTTNKSFRSEHSNTSKHVSEFTHLEIEMVFNTFDELIENAIHLLKYTITNILNSCIEDIEVLNKFISKGIIEKLNHIISNDIHKITYHNAIELINKDLNYFVKKNRKEKVMEKLQIGDDLGSIHENYLTEKFNSCVIVTHWPISIKSFYMKQCDDGTCESFDLLVPGIGELIGASQREDNYDKLLNMMEQKGINKDDLSFYLDLRKYGSCPHGGFGLGFDRLLMLITGIQNIKDVIPFPVHYKNCNF
jgi:asparaginyl-tRNA synthetase